jgi:hypothetical protein
MVVATLLLSSCASMAPPQIVSPCNNWGAMCTFHPINKDYVYPPLTIYKPPMAGSSADTNNVNVGSGDQGFEW